MKIRFKLSLDDIVALEAFQPRENGEDDNWLARNGEGLIWLQVGFLVVFFGAIMMFYVMFSSNLWNRLGGLALLAVVVTGWWQVRPAATARRKEGRLRKRLLRDEQVRNLLNSTYTLEIDESGLIFGEEREYRLWRWLEIESIDSDEERTVVLRSSRPTPTTLIIPQGGVIEGDYDDFVYELHLRLNRN